MENSVLPSIIMSGLMLACRDKASAVSILSISVSFPPHDGRPEHDVNMHSVMYRAVSVLQLPCSPVITC